MFFQPPSEKLLRCGGEIPKGPWRGGSRCADPVTWRHLGLLKITLCTCLLETGSKTEVHRPCMCPSPMGLCQPHRACSDPCCNGRAELFLHSFFPATTAVTGREPLLHLPASPGARGSGGGRGSHRTACRELRSGEKWRTVRKREMEGVRGCVRQQHKDSLLKSLGPRVSACIRRLAQSRKPTRAAGDSRLCWLLTPGSRTATRKWPVRVANPQC